MKGLYSFVIAFQLILVSNLSNADSIDFFYVKDGHLDTTVLISRMAGFDPIDALELGFYSQAPDESFKYDAVKVGLWGIFYPPYRQNVLGILHSLHGGNSEQVRKRRVWLMTKIANFNYEDKDNRWKLGFLIHAAGDAYAHVYDVKNDDVAYGPWIGHIFAPTCEKGKSPDFILANPDRYKDYISNLLKALRAVNKNDDESEELLGEFKKLVDEKSQLPLKCGTDYYQDIKEILEGEIVTNKFRSLTIPKEVFNESLKYHSKWNSNFHISKVRDFLIELNDELLTEN